MMWRRTLWGRRHLKLGDLSMTAGGQDDFCDWWETETRYKFLTRYVIFSYFPMLCVIFTLSWVCLLKLKIFSFLWNQICVLFDLFLSSLRKQCLIQGQKNSHLCFLVGVPNSYLLFKSIFYLYLIFVQNQKT
jgi:hypothetical protein